MEEFLSVRLVSVRTHASNEIDWMGCSEIDWMVLALLSTHASNKMDWMGIASGSVHASDAMDYRLDRAHFRECPSIQIMK